MNYPDILQITKIPNEIYKLFIDKELLFTIVKYTNEYAKTKKYSDDLTDKARIKNWYNLTEEELEVFI